MPIDISASGEIRAALSALGRTEDAAFSPDQRRLALAALSENMVAVLDIDIDRPGPRRHLSVSGILHIRSPGFADPHGLCFLDDATVVVANRRGMVQILRLPAATGGCRTQTMPPSRTLRGGLLSPLRWPGSVAARRLDDHRQELLICNNYAHRVSRHILEAGPGFRVTHNRVLLRRGLDIPDGIAFSGDGRWIAVSSHNTHRVLLYRNTPELGPASDPDGILQGALYPHGLRFSADNRLLLVADAGAPFVRVYARDDMEWSGTRGPLASLRVMDDATYLRGRHNPAEGGPKGIELSADMRLLVTTCEKQPLAFFDLHAELRRAGVRPGAPWEEHTEESPQAGEEAAAQGPS